jgi:putative membrane protein
VWGRVRNWFDPREAHEVGTTPDYRFSLANERTFLAWIRTGMALIGGGLAVFQLIPPLAVPHLVETLSILMVVAGAGCSIRAVDHWIRCEIAMRTCRPLPVSRFPAMLAIGVCLVAVALIGEMLFDVLG